MFFFYNSPEHITATAVLASPQTVETDTGLANDLEIVR
jgi:hypothetical protein